MLTFAIVEPGEVFDPVAHDREDLTVFGMTLSQNCEGGYAILDLGCLNERVPLPGKRVLVAQDGDLLLDGFITSSRGQVGSKIDLEVMAKPGDADARLKALVDSLKVAPYHDELTIPEDSRDDVRSVLAGYSRHIAWDRISHAVSAPDIYEGSTHLNLTPLEGTLSASVTLPPSDIQVKATASWRQLKRDFYSFTRNESGSISDAYVFDTMTPQRFLDEDSWIKPGDTLGTGFYVRRAEMKIKEDAFGRPRIEEVEADRSIDYHIDPAFLADGIMTERAEITTLEAQLEVVHTYELRRVETMTATVPLALQAGLTLQTPEELTINLQEITERESAKDWQPEYGYILNNRVFYDGEIYRCTSEHISGLEFDQTKWKVVSENNYIASRRYSSFMSSSRGDALCAHMLERARARVREASRCVRYTFDCEHPDLSLLGADTTATISSPALIGGTATGKIVQYAIHWKRGRRYAEITVACAPGTGAADTLALGAADRDTPNGTGNVSVEIKCPGSLQRAYFEEHATLPTKLDEPIEFQGETIEKTFETSVDFIPTPPPTDDLVGTISFEIEGAANVPQGTRLT